MCFDPGPEVLFFEHQTLPKLFGEVNAGEGHFRFEISEVELNQATFFYFILDEIFHALKLVVLFVLVNNNYWLLVLLFRSHLLFKFLLGL